MLSTLLAFVLALSVLIAVHEWGHYRVAVACGVRVLRYSIGFGPVLLRWRPRRQRPGQDVEYVLSAIPLGGYVKMLDEREAPVDPQLRAQAFNAQSLWRRTLIVAAGPAMNLIMAVLLYALVSWIGMQEPRAVIAAPPAASLAQEAGLQGGQEVLRGAVAGRALQPLASYDSLRWLLTRAALNGQDVELEVTGPGAGAAPAGRVLLPLSTLGSREPDDALYRRIGVVAPQTRPLIGELLDDGAAQRAGLQPGDIVVAIDGTPMHDGEQLREYIRASGADGQPPVQTWQVRRGDRELQVQLQPDRMAEEQAFVGRIGALVGGAPEMTLVRRGPLAGLAYGVTRTWELSVLSLRVLGRMVTGQVSLRNLSGPVLIADYAGRSIHMGWAYYLGFLAFISVSLGVLNLLPVPMLDGGHLMYYLWEALTGREVTGAWLARLQYAGMSILLAVMVIAIYNDIVRLTG